ncbi:uncharacterized protein (TIGR02099 family) [Povalibacter uvarum]|uniref:Uncharacterized protein (TIGR02099 family) n=1 Tax=Povalibacter uvarum TaxID=732238 RepID=A0A841HMH5_9GAMM|nr:YhdP family protein [Povalibacter uvarum]MBB6094307.1 uncharacterized protein (TIGR02099 family) [Povalibacter uvarum]
MSLKLPKPLRTSLLVLAVLVVLMGLFVVAFQVAVTRVPGYRVQLQTWLNDKTGLAIEFSRISARLRLYGPELVFDDAIVRTPDRSRVLATAQRGSVGFDLWTSISTRRLTAGRFTLDSPEIGLIRTREGRIQIVGQSALPDREDTQPIAVESLPVGQFRVRNAVISFRDEITGRGPWSASGISFRLDRQNELLELRGNASLPKALGQTLEFGAHIIGPLEEVDTLVSSFVVEGHGLDLAGWADVLPNQWLAPEAGHGSIELSASFKGREPAQFTAKIDFDRISAAAPEWITPLPGPAPLVPPADDDDDSDESTVEEPLVEEEPIVADTEAPHVQQQAAELISFDKLSLDLRATHRDNRWQVAVSDLDVSRKGSPWRSKSIQAKWSQAENGGFTVDISADRIVLENLWPLLAYLPESDAAAKLRALKARGTIENLALSAARPEAGATPRYSIKAEISNAGVQPILNSPGVRNITARIDGTDASGVAQIKSADVSFDLPRMFREPLAAQTVVGEIGWQRAAQGWRIASNDLRVTTVDGNGQGKVAVTVPIDGSSPILELDATGDNLVAKAAPKYMPANKLSPKTLGWLDHAFVEGHVRDAEVIFNGPTRALPFRNGEGVFIARGRIEQGTLLYQEGWSPAEELALAFEFKNEGLRILGGTGMVHGLKISQVGGGFRDFKLAELAIKAHAAGDLGDALVLLQTSPISDALGDQFQRLRGQGEAASDVDLLLPLKRIKSRRIEVTTHVKEATVVADGIDAPVTGLNGFLTVRQSLPEVAKLRGQWLGGPIEVAVEPVESATQAAQVTASGRATASRLTPLLKLPASAKLSGETDWQFAMRWETAPEAAGQRGQPRKYRVESNLEGLGIALPYPVGKEPAERRPLRLELEFDGEQEIVARAGLGDLRGLIRFQEGGSGWRLDRGGVRTDAVAAALPGHPGFRIEGSLDRLVLDDWFDLKGDGQGNSRLSDYLKTASLKLGNLQVFGYEFADVRGMLRATDRGWQIDVAGPSAEGELTIPEDFTGPQPLRVRLDHLVIDRVEKKPGDKPGGRDPRTWPNVQALVEDFRFQDHSIGTVDLRASRVPNGIRVDSLTIVHEAVRADAQAQWLVTPDGERSEMSATVASTDVATTLRALNYSPFMEAKHGEITAKLSWPGGFDSDFPTRASGKVTVAAESGQLLTVQPGAGRVLGLFSVGALPRRLALDFSDLTDKGLSFDEVHGDFELRDGNAYTSNLLLRGPAAEIGIAGRTGLGARDYDQTAVVTGNLGASLPVAGALAGGPAVGAALLLFSQVFKEPLKGITRGYYRITGPWDNPVVERVDAAEIKEAAAATKESSP